MHPATTRAAVRVDIIEHALHICHAWLRETKNSGYLEFVAILITLVKVQGPSG